VLQLPFGRRLATLAISAAPDGPSQPDLLAVIDDATHCPAYFQLLLKALVEPGLTSLAEVRAPVQLVTCQRDRVVPERRFKRHFTAHLPATATVARLDGVGHIPMLEAPGRVTEVIAEFVDQHTDPARAVKPTG
jgi:pimeloyl-ACP methyl ester carboxylesterase